MKTAKTIKAYHFTNGPRLRDGRPLPAVGEWLKHDGPIIPCESGLHASTSILDALKYAPGVSLHVVELRGDLNTTESDKIVGRERRILSTLEDASPVLLRFAAGCAARALEKYGTKETEGAWVAVDMVLARLAGLDVDADMMREAAEAAAWAAERKAQEKHLLALLSAAGMGV